MLADDNARRQATDPTASFIVQAPAGSGKTELLTQRYLRLLATVNQPEHIVAITFTRKAASEMRERIVKALLHAASNGPAHSPHQIQTMLYAKAALAQEQKLGWQLLEQPHRLRIMTIDALCQSIAQAIPLLEQHVPFANITAQPMQSYRRAARACLDFIESHDTLKQTLEILLRHLDNRRDKLIQLLSELLAHRPQWLQTLMCTKDESRESCQAQLAQIEIHELSRWQKSIDPILAQTLVTLTRLLASAEPDMHSPRQSLREWQNFDEINREQAEALAHTLLTGSNSIRASFDHHVGLKKGNCPAALYTELKSQSQALLATLSLNKDFVEGLIRLKSLPEPAYTDSQWQVLDALFCVLPLLVAHLQLSFREEHAVDFTHVTEIALDALGDEEYPTDLALYLDHNIHHLLVDEFQDTSITQYHLLTKLVRGFEADDGRTLFVVGDPMQSIYRFRQAEVGLFLRAKQQGIGHVSLTPLELVCNFRSHKSIIEWVNTHFKNIFPREADIESGAVSFHASKAIHEQGEPSDTEAFTYPSKAAEADGIVQYIKQLQVTHPNDNIAILVRARSQLKEIIEALRLNRIAFQGVDIDALAHSSHIQDIYTLTQALLMPAHRLSWLALLRSPFCGLDLSDVLSIASVDKNKSIYSILAAPEEIGGLSDDACIRIHFVYTVMQHALMNRHKIAIADWVANTARLLHADLLFTPTQQADFIRFWQLLDQFDRQGQIADLNAFNEALTGLFAAQTSAAKVQIMTIHKSKGLEFDTVIIPSCSSKAAPNDSPLLRWLSLPTEQAELTLVSPIKAYHEEQSLLYDYIGKLDQQKGEYELQRLLYVATTRAKKRLYLFDHRESAPDSSLRGLLKNLVFETIAPSCDSNNSKSEIALPQLFRLASSFYQTAAKLPPPPLTSRATLKNNPSSPRLVGIVAHELLQWLCTMHREEKDIPWAHYQTRLQSLGLEGQALNEAYKNLQEMMARLHACPKGQWLLKAHLNERNEYALLCLEQEDVITRIIDRTFIENGIRWIIDFKTGAEEAAYASHVAQLQEYAQLMRVEEILPIQCGLYYLASNTWKIVTT